MKRRRWRRDAEHQFSTVFHSAFHIGGEVGELHLEEAGVGLVVA
jgi:hypothetical protein